MTTSIAEERVGLAQSIARTEQPVSNVSSGIAFAAAAMVGLCAAHGASASERPHAQAVSFPAELAEPGIVSLNELAVRRPSTAVAILTILQNKAGPFERYTVNNVISLDGVPTARTVQLMLDHADEGTVLRSIEKLPINPYSLESATFLQIWWVAHNQPNGDILVSIYSEFVGSQGNPLNPREPVEAPSTVRLRKGDNGTLALVQLPAA